MSVCSFLEKLCELFCQWSEVHNRANDSSDADSSSSSSGSTIGGEGDHEEDVQLLGYNPSTPSSRPSFRDTGAPAKRSLAITLDEVGTDDESQPINYAGTTRKRPRSRTSSPSTTVAGSDTASMHSPSDSSKGKTRRKKTKRRKKGSGKNAKKRRKSPQLSENEETSDDPDMMQGIFRYCYCFHSLIIYHYPITFTYPSKHSFRTERRPQGR